MNPITELLDVLVRALTHLSPEALGCLVAGVFVFYISRFAMRVR